MHSASLIATILAGACLHVTNAHWTLKSVKVGSGPPSTSAVWSSYDDMPTDTITGKGLECGNSLTPPTTSLLVPSGAIVTGYLEYTDTIPAYMNAPEHIGPCAVYLQALNNSDSKWYKIEEFGTNACGVFCSQLIHIDGSNYEVQIPTTVPPGDYKLRFENIALHATGSPQVYGRCANIKVTGGSGKSGSLSKLGNGVVLNIADYVWMKVVDLWKIGVTVQSGTDPTMPPCKQSVAAAFNKELEGLVGPPLIKGGTNGITVGNNFYENVTPAHGGGGGETNTTTTT